MQAAVALVLGALASASIVSGAAAAPGAGPRVAPDAAAIQTSALDTVQVVATGCGGHRYGSGFAISATQIVTTAHVVAGTEYVSVKVQGRQATATVVLFDPGRDVAVLSVPAGLNLHALKSSNGFDSRVAAIGYPGGGAETVTAGVVDRPQVIDVADIYGNHVAGHQVWVTHANLHPGNSGGPLVDSQGAVMGLVFAASTTDARVAYAMTNNEIRSDLMAAQGRTQAVVNGGCI